MCHIAVSSVGPSLDTHEEVSVPCILVSLPAMHAWHLLHMVYSGHPLGLGNLRWSSISGVQEIGCTRAVNTLYRSTIIIQVHCKFWCFFCSVCHK